MEGILYAVPEEQDRAMTPEDEDLEGERTKALDILQDVLSAKEKEDAVAVSFRDELEFITPFPPSAIEKAETSGASKQKLTASATTFSKSNGRLKNVFQEAMEKAAVFSEEEGFQFGFLSNESSTPQEQHRTASSKVEQNGSAQVDVFQMPEKPKVAVPVESFFPKLMQEVDEQRGTLTQFAREFLQPDKVWEEAWEKEKGLRKQYKNHYKRLRQDAIKRGLA